jgi:hypothetical protein
MAHAYNPSYSGGRDEEDWHSKPTGQIAYKIPSQKYPTQNRVGGMAQVTEGLPSKCEKA